NKINLNRNTIQRIMQKHNLQCRVKPKRKWKSQGESIGISPDLLKRDFTASEPNNKWVTDITYIQYGSTTKYLSTIMDLFNNEIVHFMLFSHQQTPIIIETLKAALIAREYQKGVNIHSEQETVYTSYAYPNLITEH